MIRCPDCGAALGERIGKRLILASKVLAREVVSIGCLCGAVWLSANNSLLTAAAIVSPGGIRRDDALVSRVVHGRPRHRGPVIEVGLD